MANRNKTVLPTKILENLKCASCLQYLSVPTITVYPIDEGRYICGRCVEKQYENGVRARAYETLAQLFLFPCRYSSDGCKKTLPWGNSASDHEASCDFRSFECPSLPIQKCTWTGTAKDMPTHFKESHKFLYMSKSFFLLHLEENIETNKIISALNETFLVQTVLENNKFYICVKYVGKPPDSGKFCYEIELRGNTQENVLKISSKITKPVLKFDIDKKIMNEIDVNSLKSVMNTKVIICYLKISEKSASNKKPEPKKQEQAQKNESVKDNKKPGQGGSVSNSLLTELQCPVCQLYMTPPIFVCNTGHSICSKCIEIISVCPTCSLPCSGTRNYTLEKLTAIVPYPCKNQAQGCKFTGSSQEIHNHESTCILIGTKCPLEIPEKCNWQGPLTTLRKHLTKKHVENTWMKLNDTIFRNLSSTVYVDFHIIEFEKELFKICCKHSKSASGPVQWSFQHLGLGKNAPKYTCEIEFTDVNDTGRKFIINDLCYDSPKYQNTFEQALSIPYNLLEPFIKKDSPIIIFKYNMSRV